MANNKRLTKRVKIIEEWMAGNEEMGGPKGYMDTFVSLYQGNMQIQQRAMEMENNFQQLKSYMFEFLAMKELSTEWDEFLQEKDNAVQDVQEEAKSGKEENKKE